MSPVLRYVEIPRSAFRLEAFLTAPTWWYPYLSGETAQFRVGMSFVLGFTFVFAGHIGLFVRFLFFFLLFSLFIYQNQSLGEAQGFLKQEKASQKVGSTLTSLAARRVTSGRLRWESSARLVCVPQRTE